MTFPTSNLQPLMLTKRDYVIRRTLAVVLGALVVAGAAQVSIPLPGTPVPMTLQPMAVLLVGGLLGARLGALSMILYLAMGAAGLPVFTPSPVLLPGIGRLFGQTGGYLLAYPVAAWGVGWFSNPGRKPGENQSPGTAFVNPGLTPGVREPWVRVGLAVLAGLLLIHLGGLAQLAIITGSIGGAARLATWPFLLGDLLKLAVLVPVLAKLTPTIRARL
jgi:biotin transport system substrate-specific component